MLFFPFCAVLLRKHFFFHSESRHRRLRCVWSSAESKRRNFDGNRQRHFAGVDAAVPWGGAFASEGFFQFAKRNLKLEIWNSSFGKVEFRVFAATKRAIVLSFRLLVEFKCNFCFIFCFSLLFFFVSTPAGVLEQNPQVPPRGALGGVAAKCPAREVSGLWIKMHLNSILKFKLKCNLNSILKLWI